MGTRATILIAAGLVLGAGLPATPAPAAGLQVRAVKYWSLGNSTRIVIEVSDEFRYRKERLENPGRVFVDIFGAEPRIEGAPARGQQVIPVGDKFVKQIRIAEPQRGTTRVVLDLEAGSECTTSQMSDPDRLMIEVTAPGRSETPTVTPSVVVIKRFEPPPANISSRKTPPPEISLLDETAPAVPIRPVTAATVLPNVKQRRLLAAALAPPPEPIVSATRPSPVTTPAEGTALPAKTTTSGELSMTRVLGLKVKRIIIDAGHGGKDEGTHGHNGLLEKELVLDVAKRLGTLAHDRLGLEVVFTRSDDTFIQKEQRTRIANEQHGDLFISIHANSSNVRSVSGVEIYYLSFSSSKVDLETAARENADAESSVFELQTMLQKAMLNDKLKESAEFASKVLQAMAGPNSTKTRSRGVRRAPFVVLIGATMPSILAEIGFISNPADEALMTKPAYRQKIAESLVRGIHEYAQSLSHIQVAAQPSRAARTTSAAKVTGQ